MQVHIGNILFLMISIRITNDGDIMSNTALTAQDLLNQILQAGRALAQDGKEATGELTARGKEIAAKGEDILVEKLKIEDSEVGRAALRKGVGTGAAAGALALLLTSRSSRKMATIGGLGGLGMIAYKAYQRGEMPKSVDDVIGLIKGPEAEVRSEILLKAMVAAAKVDGKISESEMAILSAHNTASNELMKTALEQAPDPKEIAAMAESKQAGREIYAVSCRIANGINPKERDYLDHLAMALKIDPDVAAKIETDVRTG